MTSGGEDGNRTRLNGFAGRCITSLLPRQRNCLCALRPTLKTGAGEESRTLDLNLGKVALYQLSYSRIGAWLLLNRAAPTALRRIKKGSQLSFPLEFWSGRRVSNSRPQPWQGCALPTELLPHWSFYFLLLPCTASAFAGAGEESRTLDLNLGKVALYQLSYSRIRTAILLLFATVYQCCFTADPVFTGAGEESRTLDLNLGKVALYQLSYSRSGQHCIRSSTTSPVLLFTTFAVFTYDTIQKTGAGEESRTLDLNLGKVALYQLSYSRVINNRPAL